MKKIILSSLLAIAAFTIVEAQKTTTTKPKTATTTKPKTVNVVAKIEPAPVLKTLEDSAMYAIGVSVGVAYKKDGIKKINGPLMARGINEVMGGQNLLIKDGEATSFILNYLKNSKTKTPPNKTSPNKVH